MATMHDTLTDLLTPAKGILAADEHLGNWGQHAARTGAGPAVPPEESYHEMLLMAPGLGTYISGFVVSAESFSRQDFLQRFAEDRSGGSSLVAGVRLGTGTDIWADGPYPQHRDQVDKVRGGLVRYREAGARFVKWRADLDPMGQSRPAGYVDAALLANCAAASQEVSLLPILDIAMPNQRSHSLPVAEAVTANALDSLFVELEAVGADLSAVVLRMNMVQAGEWHDRQTSPEEVARCTLKVIADHVPVALGGILFMSTGQDNERACANLSAIVSASASRADLPWPVSFAFGRALVARATELWGGSRTNVPSAQRALIEDCRRACSALTPVLSRPDPPDRKGDDESSLTGRTA